MCLDQDLRETHPVSGRTTYPLMEISNLPGDTHDFISFPTVVFCKNICGKKSFAQKFQDTLKSELQNNPQT